MSDQSSADIRNDRQQNDQSSSSMEESTMNTITMARESDNGNANRRLCQLSIFVLLYSIIGWIIALVQTSKNKGNPANNAAGFSAFVYFFTMISSSFLMYLLWGRSTTTLESFYVRIGVSATYGLIAIQYFMRSVNGIQTGSTRQTVLSILSIILFCVITVYNWRLMNIVAANGAMANGASVAPTPSSDNHGKGQVVFSREQHEKTNKQTSKATSGPFMQPVDENDIV